MARDDYRSWRDEDSDRRNRQQGEHDSRRRQQDQSRHSYGQQRGERFGGDFRPEDGSYAAGQSGGWDRDDDFGSRGDAGRSRGAFSSGVEREETTPRYDYGRIGGRNQAERFLDRGEDSFRSMGGFDRDYGGRPLGGDRNRQDDDRDFWDKATDEVSSWFGDRNAERRRHMDKFRGRGPKNYSRSDERIREDVNDRLTDDPHIDASDIEVSVSSREVTLAGVVDDRFAKRHAEDIAESVSGVSHVQNNLRVRDRSSTGTPGLTSENGDLTGSTGTGSGASLADATTRGNSGI